MEGRRERNGTGEEKGMENGGTGSGKGGKVERQVRMCVCERVEEGNKEEGKDVE